MLRLYFPKVGIHAGAVALFAVLMQAAAIFVPFGAEDAPKRLLFEISYVLLLFFVAVNWRRLGIAIIGLGLLLNFLPIIANGGLMPVTSGTLARIDEAHVLEGLKEGDAIPYQKNVWRERENTHLYFLSDRLVWDNPFHLRVFSIGDVIVAGGLILTLGDLFLPRLQRRPQDGASPEVSV